MKISDTTPFFKQLPLFYQPLPFYGKKSEPTPTPPPQPPPPFSKILKMQPLFIKAVGGPTMILEAEKGH